MPPQALEAGQQWTMLSSSVNIYYLIFSPLPPLSFLNTRIHYVCRLRRLRRNPASLTDCTNCNPPPISSPRNIFTLSRAFTVTFGVITIAKATSCDQSSFHFRLHGSGQKKIHIFFIFKILYRVSLTNYPPTLTMMPNNINAYMSEEKMATALQAAQASQEAIDECTRILNTLAKNRKPDYVVYKQDGAVSSVAAADGCLAPTVALKQAGKSLSLLCCSLWLTHPQPLPSPPAPS